jgi:hypothetical protein
MCCIASCRGGQAGCTVSSVGCVKCLWQEGLQAATMLDKQPVNLLVGL